MVGWQEEEGRLVREEAGVYIKAYRNRNRSEQKQN